MNNVRVNKIRKEATSISKEELRCTAKDMCKLATEQNLGYLVILEKDCDIEEGDEYQKVQTIVMTQSINPRMLKGSLLTLAKENREYAEAIINAGQEIMISNLPEDLQESMRNIGKK